MAEGFEPYHVPQQSRRDKLRVLPGQTHPPCLQPDSPQHHHLHSSPLLPLYDPTCASFMSSSDFLTCQPSVKPEAHVIHHQHLMGDFVSHNSSNSSSSAAVPADAFRNHHTHNHHHQHNPFSDPHPSNDNFPPNPEINNNHFLYPPQNLQPLREFDHHHQHPPPFSHDQPSPLVFKPEPLSLSLSSSKRYGSSSMNYNSLNSAVHVASGSTDHTIGSRSSVPLGPFTGYASILKGSRFLKPAQHLLEEFCDVGSREIYNAKVMAAADSSAFLDPTMDNLSPAEDNDTGDGDGVERTARKSMLISMLDEVFRRYKQYYQQMQAVVTSFEYVAGLGNAAPYANFAIKAMTRHFKCLKHAIAEQLQSRNRDSNVTHFGQGKDETQMLHNTRGSYIQTSSIRYSDLADQHPPVWRPQRGLPERAVTVLRGWLFEHFLHPYPTDSDKVMLAKQTGLSRSQVSNWFINARVRLWKPMVEEIHMLETRQAEKGLETMERDGNRSSDQDHLPSQNSIASNRPSTTTHRVQETASKRTRNEIPVDMRTMGMSSEQMNLSYTNLPTHVNVGHVGMNNMAGGGTSNGVSLTLGLHQNNGVGFSESFPINAAQRFGLGLDGNGGQGYAMGGFEAQNRHFGRDVIGGQLLHDFVG